MKKNDSIICTFLFYNQATGKQLKYNGRSLFKHCNIIVYDGSEFVLLEISKNGIDFRIIRAKSYFKLIKNLKIIDTLTCQITVFVSERCEIKWFPLWMRTCNELSRYIASVDIGYTYNPQHLYKKLLKYDNKRNYEILDIWER